MVDQTEQTPGRVSALPQLVWPQRRGDGSPAGERYDLRIDAHGTRAEIAATLRAVADRVADESISLGDLPWGPDPR